MQQQRLDYPGLSQAYMKREWSMMDPIEFKEEQHAGGR